MPFSAGGLRRGSKRMDQLCRNYRCSPISSGLLSFCLGLGSGVMGFPAAECSAQSPLPVRVGVATTDIPLDLAQVPPRRLEEVEPRESPRQGMSAAGTDRLKNGPPDLAAAYFDRVPSLLQRSGMNRDWAQSVETWEAPALCHRPLYFEDEALERYGRSFGIAQPAVSAAHFAGRIVMWPYLAGAFPPHECIYTLGRGRPGTYTPYGLYRPPVSVRGATYEAGAVLGLAYLVP